MEMTVIEEKKNKLVFKIEGAGHTICNIIKNELSKDSNVEVVAYKIDHPLVGVPQMIIETNGKIDPRAAVTKAIKSLSKDIDKLKKTATKELK